jgi:hypothetical protein
VVKIEKREKRKEKSVKKFKWFVFSPDGSGIVFWDDRNGQQEYDLKDT